MLQQHQLIFVCIKSKDMHILYSFVSVYIGNYQDSRLFSFVLFGLVCMDLQRIRDKIRKKCLQITTNIQISFPRIIIGGHELFLKLFTNNDQHTDISVFKLQSEKQNKKTLKLNK